MASELSLDELETYGISPGALQSFSDGQKNAAISAAVDEAYAYIRQAVGVPLSVVPTAVKVHIAKMAVFHLLSARGMDPDADRLVVDNYDRATRFFAGVSKGTITLPDAKTPEDNPADDLDQPVVWSDAPRGF